MTSTYWLFRFNSYSYCQGTRDVFNNDMRLLKFTLPCEEWEAKTHLIKVLNKERIEIYTTSIECITSLITNS
jgi:hypothetical protein